MTTVTQQDFQRQMQNRQVNLDELRGRVSPEQHARLKKADSDGDGVIKGPQEMGQLWKQLDSFDRNGSRHSIDTGMRGRPSTPGRIHAAIQQSARPASQQPRRGLCPPTGQQQVGQGSALDADRSVHHRPTRPNELGPTGSQPPQPRPSNVFRPTQTRPSNVFRPTQRPEQQAPARRPDRRPDQQSPVRRPDQTSGQPQVQQTQGPQQRGRVPQTVQAAAQELLNNPNVRYWNGLSTGSDRANLERLARGEQALANATGQRVTPNLRMMQALVAMAREGPIQINALTGGRHSHGSQHYRGNAVDLAINVGNQRRIQEIARQYGGRRNGETTHMHISF